MTWSVPIDPVSCAVLHYAVFRNPTSLRWSGDCQEEKDLLALDNDMGEDIESPIMDSSLPNSNNPVDSSVNNNSTPARNTKAVEVASCCSL